MGLALVAEDRQRIGVVLDLSVAENVVVEVVGMKPYSRGGWLNFEAIDGLADRLISEYDIRCSGRKQPVRTLSGGNQQKLVLAREMFRDPVALVAMQPTRGLDVGATDQIHERLLGLRDQGTGILLVSTELDEILALADRIVVIYEGRQMGEVDRSNLRCRPARPAYGGARSMTPVESEVIGDPPAARSGTWTARASARMTWILRSDVASSLGAVRRRPGARCRADRGRRRKPGRRL